MSSLPFHVLEKIISYLDWRDLGKAMLVCHRWKETGGHPSLWKNFPLQLSGRGWESYAKIRRLAWVKSLTITLVKEGLEESADFVQPVIKHFTRTEELFVNCNGEALTYDHELNFLALLWDGTNKLVRIGISAKDVGVANLINDHWYFVPSWDPETMAFIKKTLVTGGKEAEESVSILGSSWGKFCLSYEILEHICTFFDEPIQFFRTDIMVDQNFDLSKLQNLLKNHVIRMQWNLDLDDVEDQDVAPLNAILDQLHGRDNGQSCDMETGEDHGVFLQLSLPKQLLLKSNWVERLGGKEKVDEFGSDYFLTNVYHNHKSGLRMFYKTETSEEISEDEEDNEEEEVDIDEEEDEEDDEEEEEEEEEDSDEEEDKS